VVELGKFVWKRNFYNPDEEFDDFEFMEEILCELTVPTEIIVYEAEICTPDIARVYRTGLYLLDPDDDTSLCDYDTLHKTRREQLGGFSEKDGWKGISAETAVYLFEIWLDEGDDGHIWYKHRGYAFLKSTPLIEKIIRSKKYPSWKSFVAEDGNDLTDEYHALPKTFNGWED